MPETIDDLYSEAYALIDQGICFDEVGHLEGAKTMYERGLAMIDRAGNMPNAKSSEQYQKMAKSRDYIVQRLVDIRQGLQLPDVKQPLPDTPAASGPAPVYPTVPSTSPFDSISGALLAMGDVRHANEIFCIPDGVQLFFIEGDDTSVPSYPTCLKVFRFDEQGVSNVQSGKDRILPAAFLQVGDWVHPLMPGESPVLHCAYGAYMFPGAKSDHADAAVGVMLPSDLDPSLVSEFERHMKELTLLRQQSTEEAAEQLTTDERGRLATKLARMLIAGTDWIVAKIEHGTDKGQDLIRKESQAYKEKIGPKQKDIHVDPRAQTSVHYLRKGTKVAVKVSGYLVNKLGDACVYVGKKVAKSAEGAVAKHAGPGGSQSFHDVLEVGGAGLAGAATVYMGLERSAKVLAKSIVNETVEVVNHKYGEECAKLTDNTLMSGYNAGLTAWNVSELGPKAIAKRTAKKTGLALLEDLGEHSKRVRGDPSQKAIKES